MTVSALLGPKGRAFTDEQSAAVRRRDGSLLLEANAGSGKTSVLVERFVRSVLDDGIAPGRILAITFTERAAGELRSRVRERFVELGERDAARETESAWVSTIHGFCARLLRAHAIAAGLDPAFSVLDEAAARTLRARAWDEALAGLLGGCSGAAALDLAAAYDVDRLRDVTSATHDALRSAGQTRPVLPRPPRGADPRVLRAPLAAACAAAARELAGAGTLVTLDRARATLDRCGELLATLPGDELAPGAALTAAKLAGNANALKTAACDTYREALEAYHGACRDARAGEVVALLDDLLGRYADAYAAAKRARAALDFDDLELSAGDLLAADPALRRSYADRFDRVMVDEFQDSNPRQLALFEALEDDDLFVVGDESQSIYGFRNADVDVFRSRRAALAAAGRVSTLATNFRSRGAILGTINATFAPRLGERFVALIEGREPSAAGEPLVELLVTDQAGWEDPDAPIDLGALPRAAAWRHAEARLLAQRLRELVDAGEAKPEETVVLLRGLGDLPVYERALEDQGLLTLSVGGSGYWGRQVVRDLCAWLAAIANPRDEEALYGVLASPLVGLSSDALAHIAGAGGSGGAWRSISAGGELLDKLGAGDRERLEIFAARFAAERELAPRLALDELLRRVVDATGYDLHVLSLSGGTRRLANVHKLQRLAAAFERDHGRDVRGLADRAAAELEAEAREDDAPVELGDLKAIRLMSIHAAKGLEFDVVAVADLGRRRPGDGDADLLVADGEVGLRLRGLDGSSDKALAYDRLRDRARERAAREEERVMYVAMTRARERLILSGGVTVAAWPNPGPAAPPLAWLGPALLGGDVSRLPVAQAPVADVVWDTAAVRCSLNAPQTIGAVLRAESLAPAGGELPVAPAPAPAPVAGEHEEAAPAPRTLSYSSLASWKACGYRFYLERILRLPEEPAGGPAAADALDAVPEGINPRLRGSLVHALLEEEGPAAGRVADAAARFGAGLTDAQAADVARLTDAFAQSPLAGRIERAKAVHREHGFTLSLGETLLTGVVDVLAHERGGAQLVVDYKTDGVEPRTDLDAYVDERYGVQRTVYALAALRAGAARVEVAYAFLERPQDPVVTRFAAEDADRLEAELLAIAAGPLAGQYPVSDAPHRDLCLTCPGRRALCSHPEELTLRERVE
ncbi:MAG: ATP-dependent helicase/nuclease subunit [Solirubrobacteraceae bacterium]|jgi:ATP-dependent exoDNAse (exonuclease V) beta subunit|nr:ATP-dependent helicase/nuclease subunit [Solirubrobacteraceae bacterium]